MTLPSGTSFLLINGTLVIPTNPTAEVSLLHGFSVFEVVRVACLSRSWFVYVPYFLRKR